MRSLRDASTHPYPNRPIDLLPYRQMIKFQERNAWQIDTSTLRMTILECGGHIAEIVYKPAGDINPLWIQNRPTIDSDQFDPAIHGAIYGTDGEAKLISGILGHNLCFPFWGLPSKSEEAAGMTCHGETNVVRWKALETTANSLHLGVTLPDAAIYFTREIRCQAQVIYFSETARNLSAWDRPVGWCEHVTFSPPFLAVGDTSFASNLTRGFSIYDPSRRELTWPHGEEGIPHLLTGYRATHGPDLVNSFLVDPEREHGYIVAWNPRFSLLIGYIFSRVEFPWVNVWEANNTKMQTRGMEFSNTPIDGTSKKLAQQEPIWGVPAYEWLDAKAQLRKSFAAFVSLVPDGYRGVADITIGDGKLNIAENETGNIIALEWAP